MMIVRGIHKISDALDKIAEAVIVIMLGAMVLITGAQIVCRVFFTALAWSQEATRYLLIWSTLFGAGCAGATSLCSVFARIPSFQSSSFNSSI